jgi:hypothetical protein
MRLGELLPGVVFRTIDGRVGVRWMVESRQGCVGCLWLDGHGFTTALPVDTPVEPLDLPALLEGHERARKLEEALRGLLADAEAAEEYWHGTDPAEVLPSVLAASAALGTK